MSKFVIRGARKLSGKINVSGSKNAALPIIFACIVTRGISVLYNVPDISDVRTSLSLLKNMGARIEYNSEALYIDTRDVYYSVPDEKLVSSIRASSYLLGATLARFGKTQIQRFGGCNFDNRPIDMHIDAMRALGAECDGECIVCKRLVGADISFSKISVGATVNSLILAVTALGKTNIYGYAREPHVIALCDFLISAGADIKLFDDRIEVFGRELSGGVSRIIPDMIEAGTYLIASVATNSHLTVSGIDRESIEPLSRILMHGGVSIYYDEDSVTSGMPLCEPLDIETAPYPGFPTDLQPQTAPLLAASLGGRIYERVWQNRFGYLRELSKFGLEYSLESGVARIYPSLLHSAHAVIPDLRGGAALIIAALITQGESVLDFAETVFRGYENIVQKLRCVGADIDITD